MVVKKNVKMTCKQDKQKVCDDGKMKKAYRVTGIELNN